MRLVSLLLAAIALAGQASAQDTGSSSPGAGKSSAVDTAVAADENPSALPVSLDRIRDGLKRPAEAVLRTVEVKPDFSVHIDEQRRIDEIMSKLDFKTGPVPAGGLRAYEEQRRLFNPTDRPLQQPYAAYNGGQLITLAIEGLLGRYLGGRVLSGISAAERTHAEAQAREEVAQNIAEYCAARPDRDSISLCYRN